MYYPMPKLEDMMAAVRAEAQAQEAARKEGEPTRGWDLALVMEDKELSYMVEYCRSLTGAVAKMRKVLPGLKYRQLKDGTEDGAEWLRRNSTLLRQVGR